MQLPSLAVVENPLEHRDRVNLSLTEANPGPFRRRGVSAAVDKRVPGHLLPLLPVHSGLQVPMPGQQ